MHVFKITEADGSTTQVHVRHAADVAGVALREMHRADATTRRRVVDLLATAPDALRDVSIGAGRTLTVLTGADARILRTRAAGEIETRQHVLPAFNPTQSATDGDTLDGYAVVWDYTYPVSDRQGDYMEKFKRGAFAESLARRKPLAQYDHGMHPMIGSIPVANWQSVNEDSRGLRLIGPLADSWLVHPLRSAISDGRVNGMSIRFSVVRENWSRTRDRRIITAAELYEAGPVAMPASDATSISLRRGMPTRSRSQRQALALRSGQ